jgi:hypothetical protein
VNIRVSINRSDVSILTVIGNTANRFSERNRKSEEEQQGTPRLGGELKQAQPTVAAVPRVVNR